jgi:hypothetical protein
MASISRSNARRMAGEISFASYVKLPPVALRGAVARASRRTFLGCNRGEVGASSKPGPTIVPRSGSRA